MLLTLKAKVWMNLNERKEVTAFHKSSLSLYFLLNSIIGSGIHWVCQSSETADEELWIRIRWIKFNLSYYCFNYPSSKSFLCILWSVSILLTMIFEFDVKVWSEITKSGSTLVIAESWRLYAVPCHSISENYLIFYCFTFLQGLSYY